MPDLDLMRPREEAIDWKEAARFLRSCLAARDPSLQPTDVDELTQEAVIRLLRAVRRGEVTNLNGLMYKIVHDTRVDFTRRGVRDRARRGLPPGGIEALPAPSPGSGIDPIELIRFIVLEFFRVHHSACRELAEIYFERGDWQSVATRLGRTHAAVRKQWSRCVQRLREEAARNPSWRADFLRRDDCHHDDGD